MTICMKCGRRWETRDGSAEEEKYRMYWQCIEEAREKGEIPPKPEFISLLEVYGLVEKELEE